MLRPRRSCCASRRHQLPPLLPLDGPHCQLPLLPLPDGPHRHSTTRPVAHHPGSFWDKLDLRSLHCSTSLNATLCAARAMAAGPLAIVTFLSSHCSAPDASVPTGG